MVDWNEEARRLNEQREAKLKAEAEGKESEAKFRQRQSPRSKENAKKIIDALASIEAIQPLSMRGAAVVIAIRNSRATTGILIDGNDLYGVDDVPNETPTGWSSWREEWVRIASISPDDIGPAIKYLLPHLINGHSRSVYRVPFPPPSWGRKF